MSVPIANRLENMFVAASRIPALEAEVTRLRAEVEDLKARWVEQIRRVEALRAEVRPR